jgi:hypothetical protein
LSIFLVDDPRHFDGTADRDALETEKWRSSRRCDANSPRTGYSTTFGAYDDHQVSIRNDNQQLIRYLLLEERSIAVEEKSWVSGAWKLRLSICESYQCRSAFHFL